MKTHLPEPFIIKIESDEANLNNQFESALKQELCNDDKKTISYLKQKLHDSQKRLKNLSYQQKQQNAYGLLTRNKIIKANKKLKNENTKLKHKLKEFNELAGCLNKLCDKFNHLNNVNTKSITQKSNSCVIPDKVTQLKILD